MIHQQRVLVVDDNPTNIELLLDILEDDYTVASAKSGEEALAKASDFHPHLILLDIMMPGIDGYETCRRIRKTESLKNVKIIMLSAKAMLPERLEGYNAGADDYITKPFEEDELLAKVSVYTRLKRVEELDQFKSDMLALLSHEVRTPLTGIMPALTMLISENDLKSDEQKVLLDTAYQSAERLLNLFDRAVTLCTMKAGEYDCHFVPDDLCSVVTDVICSLTERAAAREVHIKPLLPHTAAVNFDRSLISDVVKSLLDNAISYSPWGSEVVIEVSRQGDDVCLTVSDKGAGIDPNLLPHLFSEFVTSDIMHHSQGHGLSLAIAHQTVLMHKGKIRVESTIDTGTTFTVQLPALPASDNELEPLHAGSHVERF